MKKILLTGLLFLGMNANSQIVNGSVAPDFTLLDINGTPQNLYTYLDQGKTVFIDISATWCGPCWSYHNSNALEDLWVNHGPTGGTNVSNSTTNDVIVLFIEGDPTTSNSQLNGGSGSQGNWVTGVSHPIIDLQSADANTFLTNYDITGYPTIIKICPNRLRENVGQLTASQLYAEKQICPALATSDVDVLINSITSAPNACPGFSYTPIVKIMNNSTTPLTSATVTIKSGSNTISTGTFSSTLAKYGMATIACSAIQNFVGGNVTIDVATNGDVNTVNNIQTKNIALSSANVPGTNVVVKISTDKYGRETTWAIKGLNGSTKTTGGPYPNGTSSVAIAQADKSVTLTNGCYYLEVEDSYGDGFTGSSGNGSILITQNGVTYAGVTNFTSDYTSIGFVVNSALAGLDDFTNPIQMSIYPNPANEKLNVSFNAENEDYTINISDISGRVLSTNTYDRLADYQEIELPLTGISAGNYIVSISSIKGIVNQHVVIE